MKEFGSIPDQPIVSPQAATSRKPSLPADRCLCPSCGEVRLVQAFRMSAGGVRSPVCKACAAKARAKVQPKVPVVEIAAELGISRSAVYKQRKRNVAILQGGEDHLSVWVIVTADGGRSTIRADRVKISGGDLLATGRGGNLIGAWKGTAWAQFWRVDAELAPVISRAGRKPSKLTDRDVTEIRQSLAAGECGRSVAEKYGVSDGYVYRIGNGYARRRVTSQVDRPLSPHSDLKATEAGE